MRPPLPPFTLESAIQKVRLAENGWNGKNPEIVSLAYTENSVWRNRDQFISGREEIISFLEEKWSLEQEYRLVKELFAFTGNRIAVRYAYEFHDEAGDWHRAYGNENWIFSPDGLMNERFASINNVPINESQRLFKWADGPRPEDHPSLTELGL